MSWKRKVTTLFLYWVFCTDLLPCGIVYMAILGVLTKSTSISILSPFYMFLFGLGSIPLKTVAVYLANFAKEILKHLSKKPFQLW